MVIVGEKKIKAPSLKKPRSFFQVVFFFLLSINSSSPLIPLCESIHSAGSHPLRLIYRLFDLSFLFCINFTSPFALMGLLFALLLWSLSVQKGSLIPSSWLKKKKRVSSLDLPVCVGSIIILFVTKLLSSLFHNHGQLVGFVWKHLCWLFFFFGPTVLYASPQRWKRGVLTTGPAGESSPFLFLILLYLSHCSRPMSGFPFKAHFQALQN